MKQLLCTRAASKAMVRFTYLVFFRPNDILVVIQVHGDAASAIYAILSCNTVDHDAMMIAMVGCQENGIAGLVVACYQALWVAKPFSRELGDRADLGTLAG